MSTPTPERWASETARSLVTVYLASDDDLDLDALLAELLDESSKEQLVDLMFTLVSALGDVFVDLQDYSHNVIHALGGDL